MKHFLVGRGANIFVQRASVNQIPGQGDLTFTFIISIRFINFIVCVLSSYVF